MNQQPHPVKPPAAAPQPQPAPPQALSPKLATALSVALALVLLGVWQWWAQAGEVSALVLPAPSAVAQALWRGLVSGYFWPHLYASAQAVLLGWLLGSGFGFAIGLALAQWRWLEQVCKPYIIISQVLPKLALAPLFVLWLGFGLLPVIIMTALICFFPLMENTLMGLRQVDGQRLQLFRVLGASRWQILWRLQLPIGLPAILAGLRVAAVLALVGTVVAEFMGASQGLGAVVIAAQGMMDTSLLFAALVLIALLGLLLYYACWRLERRLLRMDEKAG